MRRIHIPNMLAKLGWGQHKARLQAAAAAGRSVLPQTAVISPVAAAAAAKAVSENSKKDVLETKKAKTEPDNDQPREQLLPADRVWRFATRHWLGASALLALLIGFTAIQIGGSYWSTHKVKPIVTSTGPRKHTVPQRGPNMIVPADQLQARLDQITAQPINLIIGDRPVPVDGETIKSWLHIVTDKKQNVAYIHLNEEEIGPSLKELTSKYEKSPSHQVTTTYADGSSAVIVRGREGVSIGDPSALGKQIAPNILSAKGAQLDIPLQPVAFQSLTPAAFDKLIEVNVITKQMYLYDKGNFTRQYPISAGAPETPTPIGQFKVYSKIPLQDMRGDNPDGTRYFQPNVRWISYFRAGGYAVHGNYWRPASWFGNINSSHGCVSLPEDQAKQVYDWTTIGTTVIVHT